MKYKRLTATLVIIITIFATCKKDDDNNSGGAPAPPAGLYPMALGNKWNYERQGWFTDDSTQTDSLLYQDDWVMRFDRMEMLTDSSITYALEMYDSAVVPSLLYGTNLYNATSTGLYCYGYVNNPIGPVYLMPGPQTFLKVGDMYFSSARELINAMKNGTPERTDSIILESPPLLVLKNPVSVNDSWNFRTSPFTIRKFYRGMETVNTPFGNFSCKKLEWKYDLNNDSIWENTHLWQYISPTKGLLKETFDSHAVWVFSNGDTLGTGTIWENAFAVSVNF